jgi:hypothetical protein
MRGIELCISDTSVRTYRWSEEYVVSQYKRLVAIRLAALHWIYGMVGSYGMDDNGGLLVYDGSDGASIEARFEKDTPWLSLKRIAELFGRDKSVVSRQIKNIFQTGKLENAATVVKYS